MRRVVKTSLGFLPPWEPGWKIAKPQDTGPHITQTHLFRPYKDSDGKSELNQVNASGWIFTYVATTRKMQVWADICGPRLCEQKSPKAWRSLGSSKRKWSSMCQILIPHSATYISDHRQVSCFSVFTSRKWA